MHTFPLPQKSQWPPMTDVPAGTTLEFYWGAHVRVFHEVRQFHIDEQGNHWLVCQADTEGNIEMAVVRPTWDYKRQTSGAGWVI